MKTNSQLLIFLLSLLTVANCKSPEGHLGKPTPVYIILCDFSASLDTTSLRVVRERPLAIFDRYYGQVDLQCYSITGGSSEPFYRSSLQLIDTANLSMPEFNKQKNRLVGLKKEERLRLAQALNEQSKSRPRETRIVQAIEGAFNVLRQTAASSEGTVNKVFVLSDMLEFGTSSLGTFNLEDHEYETDFAQLEKSSFRPSSDLKQDVEVQIGYYTQRVEKLDQLNAFWNQVFRKLGYSRSVLLSSQLRL